MEKVNKDYIFTLLFLFKYPNYIYNCHNILTYSEYMIQYIVQLINEYFLILCTKPVESSCKEHL